MPEDIDLKLVDKRVAARYLEKGRLDEKDYEKYMRSLPDLAEEAVPIESDLEAMGLEEEDAEEVAQAGQQEAAPQAAPEAETQEQPAPQPLQDAEPAQPPAPPAPEPQGS
jgi:hypothetical protein